MADITVKPSSFQSALDRAGPSDRIQLLPGKYDDVYTISRRRGQADSPIIIEPAPDTDPADCEICQGQTVEDFRKTANRMAQLALDIGYSYPGLYPWIDSARLRIYRCRHVVVRNLRFRQSWPTHIFIEGSRDITVQDCAFEDATFCIGAGGATTRDLLIERCSWTQDTVPGRIWRQIPWHRIHGTTVDEAGDYRLFDGDFFRSNEIQGGVTIRHCLIKAAFNGVHGYNAAAAAPLNRDFHIYGNRFEEIRDNVFEPEDGAANWWFHDNDMIDVHKWFSIECHTRGPMYVFSNTGSVRTQQGSDPLPGEKDKNIGGSVFKTIKLVSDAKGPFAPLYVFHNSFVTRSRYIKVGLLPQLKHINNAISYMPAPGETSRTGGFFGKPLGAEYKSRFTSSWGRWDIAFDGDVIGFPGFADELRVPGYPLNTSLQEKPPGFVGPGHQVEEFETVKSSPCRNASVPFVLFSPSGQKWESAGGDNVGALQGPFGSGASQRFKGPDFEPTLNAIDDPKIG